MDKEKYSKLLIESGLFFYGVTKGNFILPPRGYSLWKNIQETLDKKFAKRGVQNVLLPTLIPLSLLEKEKKHVAGFSPECFYIERIGKKKLENPLVLRPTSEVLFYDWYRQILRSYQQLPFLYNQWCSVFRGEKNTNPFFRNTEFLWQEGHTLHISGEEAREFSLNILADYKDYSENILCLGVIVGRKTEGEKFAGALETYTVECLLPDGQCLQLATSHYFGDSFCRLMNVKFQNKNNQDQYPFSTSWAPTIRAIGAVAKTHADNWGIILPFEIAPVQVAFILIGESKELFDYYREISSLLASHYRCQLYNKSKQINLNILQADQEGCPLKIILGPEEVKKKEITLVRRDNIERKITINLTESEAEPKLAQKHLVLYEKFLADLIKLTDNEESKKGLATGKEIAVNSFKKGAKSGKLFKVITSEIAEFKKIIYQKSVDFRDQHIFAADNFSELEKKIKQGVIGLFLIPFCNNNLDCEENIKVKVPSYSVRCIPLLEKSSSSAKKCLFCQLPTLTSAYLGRSY